MPLFPINTVSNFFTGFVSMLTHNLSSIFWVLAFTVAISVIMGIVDSAKEGRL